MVFKMIAIVCWMSIAMAISSCTKSVPVSVTSSLITPTMTAQPIKLMSAPLSFELKSAQDTFQFRESIPITLSLTNTGTETLMIKSSWTDTVPAKETWGKMRIVVTDTLGNQEEEGAILSLQPPSDESKEIISLALGEAYSVRLDDARWFFVFKPGHQYLIWATYQHHSSEGWQGELKSDPILLTIQ